MTTRPSPDCPTRRELTRLRRSPGYRALDPATLRHVRALEARLRPTVAADNTDTDREGPTS